LKISRTLLQIFYACDSISIHPIISIISIIVFIYQLKDRLFTIPQIGGYATMGGGTDGKSVVYNIMSFENRQIFYLINNISKKIIARNIDINNKEN
jgi:hypothetical protein